MFVVLSKLESIPLAFLLLPCQVVSELVSRFLYLVPVGDRPIG